MNYQEYDWYFNPDDALGSSGEIKDPWATTGLDFGTCIGQECCSTGQTWDASLNQCIGTSTVVDTFVNQNMIETFLTKKEPGHYKSDYVIRENYEAPMSKSFVNNSSIK